MSLHRFESFKAGRWVQRYQYKSFEPVPVNHEWTWEAGIKHHTVNALVADFVRLGILVDITGQRRGRQYAFERYFRLFVM